MRFIDGHLHTDMVEDVQLQKLVMMGMEAAVIPSPHMFLGNHDADTVLLLWERFLTMEVNTAATLGYQAFASLSVPFFGVNHADAETCLARLPEFLTHERVVAIGEIGLDAARPSRPALPETAPRQGPRPAGGPGHAHPPRPAGRDHHAAHRGDHRRGGVPGRALRVRPRRRGDPGAAVCDRWHGRPWICWDKMPPEPAARYVVETPSTESGS